MKYCQKCEKETPSKIINNKEECMVCGTEISKNRSNFLTAMTMKEVRDIHKLIKTDKNTGKYTNAQTVGRNLTIGILVIFAGIMYMVGGIWLVAEIGVILVVVLILLSIILYIAALWSLHFDKKNK